MQRRELLQIGASLAAGWATTKVAQALPSPTPVIDTHIHLFDPGRPGGVPWPSKTDTALYQAKAGGRNCTVVAAPLAAI